MIVVNFKNYAFGNRLLYLVKLVEKFCKEAIICVPSTEINRLVRETRLQIFAQHFDYKKTPLSTGFVTAEAIKKAGAKGSLLNHSEHPIRYETIKEMIKTSNKLSLKIILCSSSLKETKKLIRLRPFAVAYEEPNLIGKGISITSRKERKIKEFASLFQKTNVKFLCGAGISNKEDIVNAFKLGCDGVLISSAIANSLTPEKFLSEISNKKFTII